MIALCELWFASIYASFYVDAVNREEMWRQIGSNFVDMSMMTMGMLLLFTTDLLISSVSSFFILRGFVPVLMLNASLFCAWYSSFDGIEMSNINWPLSIVARNGYYILITMCSMSIFKWISDQQHKYFVFILDLRKRSILHQHQYRETPNVPFMSRQTSNSNIIPVQHAKNAAVPVYDYDEVQQMNQQNDQSIFQQNRMQRLKREVDGR